jgi:hypothetical protein
MRDWVLEAIEHSGLSQAEITRKLHSLRKWPDNRSVFNKIVKGRREVGAQEMYDISLVTKYPIPIGGQPRRWEELLVEAVNEAKRQGADAAEIHLAFAAATPMDLQSRLLVLAGLPRDRAQLALEVISGEAERHDISHKSDKSGNQ